MVLKACCQLSMWIVLRQLYFSWFLFEAGRQTLRPDVYHVMSCTLMPCNNVLRYPGTGYNMINIKFLTECLTSFFRIKIFQSHVQFSWKSFCCQPPPPPTPLGVHAFAGLWNAGNNISESFIPKLFLGSCTKYPEPHSLKDQCPRNRQTVGFQSYWEEIWQLQ